MTSMCVRAHVYGIGWYTYNQYVWHLLLVRGKLQFPQLQVVIAMFLRGNTRSAYFSLFSFVTCWYTIYAYSFSLFNYKTLQIKFKKENQKFPTYPNQELESFARCLVCMFLSSCFSIRSCLLLPKCMVGSEGANLSIKRWVLILLK